MRSMKALPCAASSAMLNSTLHAGFDFLALSPLSRCRSSRAETALPSPACSHASRWLIASSYSPASIWYRYGIHGIHANRGIPVFIKAWSPGLNCTNTRLRCRRAITRSLCGPLPSAHHSVPDSHYWYGTAGHTRIEADAVASADVMHIRGDMIPSLRRLGLSGSQGLAKVRYRL